MSVVIAEAVDEFCSETMRVDDLYVFVWGNLQLMA